MKNAKDALKTILITGGTGFIGSHICVELLGEGFDIVIVDNLINSNKDTLDRITRIAGRSVIFHKADIRDYESLEDIFRQHPIDAVIHCAGLKSVRESVEDPLLYYDNNVNGSMTLMRVMKKYAIKKLVFSSSATVYDGDAPTPYNENTPLKPVNPYGKTKLFVEEILRDISSADPEWRITLLRYFNPIGAHPSGLIGEDPRGAPNNLLPYVCQVALGQHPELLVFGNDYETPDGTGVRDYIHIVDLARGHVEALKWLGEYSGVLTVNLGTGKGVSVIELVTAFERATGRHVPYRVVGRRSGDIATSYANPSVAAEKFDWHATRTINEACRDAWHWQELNQESPTHEKPTYD